VSVCRLSQARDSVFCGNEWADRGDFWHGGLLPVELSCVCLKIKVLPFGAFPLDLENFATARQESQSVVAVRYDTIG